MIFLGLGNSNKKYIRHNIGHIFLNQFAEENECQWIDIDYYQYFKFNNNIFIKPKQFFTANNIILDIFKNFDFSKHDLIVIHDDVFLPLGKIKLKLSKHKNPYQSVQLIRNEYTNFIELKIGIDSIQNIFNEIRAKDKSKYMLNYINQDFMIEEYSIIMKTINKIINNFNIFNNNSLIKIQSTINSNQFNLKE